MKGKHAKSSANRQDRQALVDAAEQAKLRADRAEKERDEVLARTARQVEAAQQEAATAKRLLTEGSSPEIERLRAEIERLRGERNEARASADRIQENWEKTFTRLTAFLSERFEVHPSQAMELILEAISGQQHNIVARETVAALRSGALTDDQVLAIEQARGLRTGKRLSLDPGSAA